MARDLICLFCDKAAPAEYKVGCKGICEKCQEDAANIFKQFAQKQRGFLGKALKSLF